VEQFFLVIVHVIVILKFITPAQAEALVTPVLPEDGNASSEI
jgi:hypothetical protein